jgi:hypothetical protein
MTLAPGLYVTTRAVKNPKPDRRVRDTSDRWAQVPEIREGTFFRVYEVYYRGDSGAPTRLIENLHGQFHADLALESTEPPPVLPLLLAALEPHPPTLASVMRDRGYYYADRLLEKLIECGRVSLADVETACDLIDDDDDREAAEHHARKCKPVEGRCPQCGVNAAVGGRVAVADE